jgi:fimbrial chaperone protein
MSWTRSRPVLATLLLVGGVVLAPPARAADFTVNPIQIFFTGQTQSAILTVQNTSGETLRFQLNAYAWAQEPSGQMQLTPTGDIIFFPRLLSLAPREQRIVRVGASVPPGAVERTYRIFVEELPPLATENAPPGQVRVLARMGIPIFVASREARAELRLTGVAVQPGRVRLELHNAGTKHVVPQRVQVRGLGPADERVWERGLEGWYILAGDRRIFEIPLGHDECLRTRAIAVEIVAGEPPLTERFAVAPQACGP